MAHRNSKTPRNYIEGFINAATTEKTQKASRTRQAVEQTPDLPDAADVSNRLTAGDITPRQMIEDFMHMDQTVVSSIRGKRGRSLDQSLSILEKSRIRSKRSSFSSNLDTSRYGEKETPRAFIEGYLAAVGSDVEETPALFLKEKKPLKRRSMPDVQNFSAAQFNSSLLNDLTEDELTDEPKQIKQPRLRNKIELHVPTKDSNDTNDVFLAHQGELQRFKRPRTRNRIQLSVPPRQNEEKPTVKISHLDETGVILSSQANALETAEVDDHTSSLENDLSLDSQPGEHITQATQEIIKESEVNIGLRETTEHSINLSAYESQEPSSDYTKRTSLHQLQTPRSSRSKFQANVSVEPVLSQSAKTGNKSLYASPSHTLVSPQPDSLTQCFQTSIPDVGISPARNVMSQQNRTSKLPVSSPQLEATSSHLSQSSVNTQTLSQIEIQTRAIDDNLEALPSSVYTKRTHQNQHEATDSPTLTKSISEANLFGSPRTPFSAGKGKDSSRGSMSQTLISPHVVVTPQSVRDSLLDKVSSKQSENPLITVSSCQVTVTCSGWSQSRIIHTSSQQEIITGGSMGSVAFDQQNKSGFAELLGSAGPSSSEKQVDPSNVHATFPGITRTSTPVYEQVNIQKTRPKRKKANTVDYTIPPSIVKKLLATMSSLKFSKEAVEEVCIWSEDYFDQMAIDLEAYAVHAGRKTITEADVELLMRRQGFINEKTSLNSLIEQHLPHEYRRLLIPIARSGNHIEKK